MRIASLYFILIAGLFLFSECSNTVREIKPESGYQYKVDSLLKIMTLEEKVGQLNLLSSGWDVTGPAMRDDYIKELKAGRVGAIFNALSVPYNKDLQRIAVEETRLGIPLLFGYDVIHGYKTIFPIPLAESSSWDLELIEKSARLSAEEAAAEGINWVFNPMVDISIDPRWGRVAEGSGEDTYLGSLIAAAKVSGYQGNDLGSPASVVACVKHYAAYGAALAGRDYGTVDMSDRKLKETYLPPFKAAVDAGVGSIMTSFNELDAVPATANNYLLKDILKNEWNFQGFVVTDYSAIKELMAHGVATNEKQAGEISINAGVDMDMQSGIFMKELPELLKENKVKMADIDDAVRRILTIKYQLGLFEDPYLYLDENRQKEVVFSDKMMDHSLDAARKSIVLLKNNEFNGKKLLPLSKKLNKVAVIGPMADNQLDMLGTWHSAGDKTKVTTVLQGLKETNPNTQFSYAKGCDFVGNDKSGFEEAVKLAKQSDLVVMAVGEKFSQNGEAASRSDISLPGAQLDLIKEIEKTEKPMVVLVMAGRPLILNWINDHIPAVLNTWHLGTKGGLAIAQVLYGEYNPAAKLTMSFPRNVGQIPVYYNDKNTGRPFNKNDKYTSKYLDVPNDPLFPFGYGLSYSDFEYSNLQLSDTIMTMDGHITISVDIENKGPFDGEEIAQLYVRDIVGSVTRPVKELKGFQKLLINKNEITTVIFELHSEDLAFYTKNMEFKAEPGAFKVFIGTNSQETLSADFVLRD